MSNTYDDPEQTLREQMVANARRDISAAKELIEDALANIDRQRFVLTQMTEERRVAFLARELLDNDLGGQAVIAAVAIFRLAGGFE